MRVLNHENEGLHVSMDVTEHGDDTGLLKTMTTWRLAFAIFYKIKARLAGERKDIVKDRVVIREIHCCSERDRENVRQKGLALLTNLRGGLGGGSNAVKYAIFGAIVDEIDDDFT